MQVPTTVANRSAWLDAGLEDENTVTDVSASGNNLTIELARGTYTLRMLKVGVGTSTTDPAATYIIPTDRPRSTVSEGRQTDITVEVRDRFNNPVDSAAVTGEIVSISSEFDGENGGSLHWT